MRARAAVWPVLAAAVAAALSSSPAWGDEESTASTCARAFEEGQRQRRDGAYTAARELFLVCSQAPCSPVLQPMCTEWAFQVGRLMPTIVVSVQTSRGDDVVVAKVYVDGRMIADHLDGRATMVDPGKRMIRVDAAGSTIEREVLVTEGEKGRPVVFRLGADGPSSPAGSGAKPAPSPLPSWPAYVAAGIAVIGLATFVGFGLDGEARYDAIERCRPFCTTDEVEATKRTLLTADVGLTVSAVALAFGIVWWFSARKHPDLR